MELGDFGRYRLLELIGEGGMGQVFKARDQSIWRDVAIKVLPADLANEPGYRERFRRESLIAARLSEPHIIPIHDMGETDGRLYLVMPLVEGVDVASLLMRHGPMTPRLAVRVIEQLAAALDAAHGQGLVHRDVKPSNALLTGDTGREFVYLIDFGIARDGAATRITATGSVLGTVAYMAPERFTDGSADARSDIYALACVLYECLTGRPPFAGDMQQQIAGHLTSDPPRPSATRPDTSPVFDEVVARGMAKDASQRYQSALDLAAAAKHALAQTDYQPAMSAAATREWPHEPVAVAPQTISTRRRRRTLTIAGSAAVVLAVAAVLGYLAVGQSQSPATQPTGAAKNSSQIASPAPPPSRQIVLPFTDVHGLGGVAVDGAGTVYVTTKSGVRKLSAGSNTETAQPLASAFDQTRSLAVDAAGNIYFVNTGDYQVLKLSPGSGAPVALPFGRLNIPGGVAVDSAGSVYVADSWNNRVLKLSSGSEAPTEVPFSGLNDPDGVAVDSAGSVYVVDKNRVLKLQAGSNSQTLLPFHGLNWPIGVAVDSAGEVYVADERNNRVLALPAGSDQQVVLPFANLDRPFCLAVDSNGAVYVGDFGNRVLVLPPG